MKNIPEGTNEEYQYTMYQEDTIKLGESRNA